MARTKIAEMKSVLRRAEKAEAKLTKRERENIEKGRKVREILSLIEHKTDDFFDLIAEAYASVPTDEVNYVLNSFSSELRSLLDKYSSVKEAENELKSELNVSKTEVKNVQSPVQNAESSVSNTDENVKDYQMNLAVPQTGLAPGNGSDMQQNSAYYTGGIQYDMQ